MRVRHLNRIVSLLVAGYLIGAVALPGYAVEAADPELESLFVEAVLPADDLALSFPQDAQVTFFDDTWGQSRSGGRRHHGNDLMAPKMSPVYAVADGVVTIKRRSGSAGRWIAIEHAAGVESWYMHLNNDEPGTDNGRAGPEQTYAPNIEVGTFVSAGQLIGYVGDSGNAEPSGSHTHFELHVGGGPVDPYELLVDARDRALEIIRFERMEAIEDLLE